jgi:hypothetical protein
MEPSVVFCLAEAAVFSVASYQMLDESDRHASHLLTELVADPEFLLRDQLLLGRALQTASDFGSRAFDV